MNEKPADLLQEAILRIGDGEATEEDYRLVFFRYRPMVRAFFARMGVPAEDRPDLTQDVFFRVSTGRGTFKNERSFRSWLLTIARNGLRNRYRDSRAQKRDGLEESLSEQTEERLSSAAVATGAPAARGSVLDELLEQEKRQELMDAIGALPVRMRQCMILRVVDEYSYAEIARILRISVETVKAHLHQGRQRLRLLLTEKAEVPSEGG